MLPGREASGVRVVINSLEQAARWHAAGGGLCDVMVDTGINRLGLPMAALGDPAIRALDVDVLHSHLASADEDSDFNAVQCARWQQARSLISHRRAALANSAGIALGAAYHGDLTRPGLALYGGVPRGELAGAIVQVARPMAAVMQVRSLEAGETVGYNRTYCCAAFDARRRDRAGLCRWLSARWSGKGMARWHGHRTAGAGPGVDGHDRDRSCRRAGLAARATGWSWTMPCRKAQRRAACRNMNCSRCWASASRADATVPLLRSKLLLHCRCCTC